MREIIQFAGKITGIVTGAAVCACWMFALWVPQPELPLSSMSFTVALLMAMLAIIAVNASLRGHGVTLIVLFFASFFPIGMYLLQIPGWIRVIGILNLGYLIAGLIAWRMPQQDIE